MINFLDFRLDFMSTWHVYLHLHTSIKRVVSIAYLTISKILSQIFCPVYKFSLHFAMNSNWFSQWNERLREDEEDDEEDDAQRRRNTTQVMVEAAT